MIDFRYHMVSIVSIFLALAVGIVLGAGPLQQGITSTVSQELSQLRQDKSDLRSQLEAETQGAQARDAFTAAANPTLVADALVGRSVSLVLLPGADAGLAKSTATLLEAAGAQVSSTTTIHDAWASTDQQKSADRQQLADRLATSLGADPASADGSAIDAVLAKMLVREPVSADSGVISTPDPSVVMAAVADLTQADLLEVDVKTPIPAQLSVVIAANGAPGTTEADKAAMAAYVTLVTALDRGGSGAVLASNVGVTGTPDELSVVNQLRADADAVKAVSTVDDAGLPMGEASIVFALDEQLAGGAGEYGLASGVTAAFAPLPAP